MDIRYKKVLELIKGSGVILLFKIAGAASMFFVNIVIAKGYGASALGIYSILLTIIYILDMIVKMGLDILVLRVIPTLGDREKIGAFIVKVFIRLFISSVLIFIIFLFIKSYLSALVFTDFDGENALLIISALIFPYSLYSVIPDIIRGLNDIFQYSLIRNLIFQLALLSSIATYVYFEFSNFLEPLFISIAISCFIAIIIFWSKLKQKKINLNFKQYNGKILKKSYNMFFTSSILLLMGNTDQLMIGYFIDESYVGYYTACLKVGIAITFILSSVSSYITPQISKAFYNKNFTELKSVYINSNRLIWFSSIPVIIILFLFSEYILSLFGNDFTNHLNTFYIILLMNCANIFFGPLLYILNMMDQEKYVRNVLLVSLLINIGINIILIPKIGIMGAAIATLISTFLWKLSLYRRMTKVLKNND